RDFEKAAKVGALQNPVQQTSTNRAFRQQIITENSAEPLELRGNSKKFPEACKSQGDSEHIAESTEKTRETQNYPQGALQNPVHSTEILSESELLRHTIAAHVQGDIE